MHIHIYIDTYDMILLALVEKINYLVHFGIHSIAFPFLFEHHTYTERKREKRPIQNSRRTNKKPK